MAANDIPEELQKKIAKWESNKVENRSLRTLEDMAAMMEEVVTLLDSQRESGKLSSKEIGAVLVDMRESLHAIKGRKEPEMPDHSKPLLAGLQKLEKAFVAAIDSIDMKPEFKPNISVNAPEVNVTTPEVDFSKVERVLKVDIPQAFKEAIASIPAIEIPETDLVPLLERLDNMSEQLGSIDTASRMKPQFPGTMKVTNPDGTNVSIRELVTERYDYDVATTIYTAYAPLGTANGTTGWTITKYDLTDTNDASGKVVTGVSWDNRATGTYT